MLYFVTLKIGPQWFEVHADTLQEACRIADDMEARGLSPTVEIVHD